MRAVAVIPARYASTRFMGKPLALIGGKPMITHVYENVAATGLFDEVIIATDSDAIFDVCHNQNQRVVMTSEHHLNGTERIAEAIAISGIKAEVFVNVQGDEPFISKQPLEAVLSLFENKETEIGTLIQPIESAEDISNPNVVKAVIASNGKVLYFSRATIPFIRNNESQNTVFYKHVGIYAFRTGIIEELVVLPPSKLEVAESLEQLRWLENGYSIFAGITYAKTIAVDTPEDLKKAEHYYQNTPQPHKGGVGTEVPFRGFRGNIKL